ncbi:MAG TPA: hypothetical protein VN762_06710, partial [Steroidobacteraceae bacterium]|nr:hypothetical protein [Steroidobacteraceae bacterium]
MNHQQYESRLDDEGIERYLTALAVPPMPEDLPARCRRLVAANDASASSGIRNARSGRLILLGTLLAVGAAAAMLIMQFAPAPEKVAPVQASVPEAAEPAAAAPAVDVAEVRKTTTAPLAQAPKPFVVRVLPLQNGAQDVPTRLAIETFYASQLERLRSVPGLTLITSQSTGIADDTPVTYEISVKG